MSYLMPALEYGGAIAGVAGTLMISSNTRWSRWAWPVWVLSSTAVAIVAGTNGLYGIAAMQTIYTVINLFGGYRWILRPYLLSRSNVDPLGA